MLASSSFQTRDKSVPAFFGWDDCARNIRDSVYNILEYYRKTLGENLTGFYLHGSLAMGCFNPFRSDIDFLATVREKLTITRKRTIIGYLHEHRTGFPAKGVEMSIVPEKDVRALSFPTPYELHYSDDWYQRYQKGEVGLSSPQTDEDLVAHFAIVKKKGICLYGRLIDEMFPEIPDSIYIRSLLADARWIYERTDQDPVYAVLNLSRILAFLKERNILSKREGALWALAALPPDFSPPVKAALACYAGLRPDLKYDDNVFNRFLEYTRNEIASLAGDI